MQNWSLHGKGDAVQNILQSFEVKTRLAIWDK